MGTHYYAHETHLVDTAEPETGLHIGKAARLGLHPTEDYICINWTLRSHPDQNITTWADWERELTSGRFKTVVNDIGEPHTPEAFLGIVERSHPHEQPNRPVIGHRVDPDGWYFYDRPFI